MCGIFGISTRKGHQLNREKIIRLGIFNDSRGKDSSGYYWNGNIERGADTYGTDSVKQARFSDLFAQRGLNKGDLKMNGDVFIGHTRKGTIGSHSLENAHPFQIGDYVQVHNGTIDNIKEVTEKFDVDENYIVDSKGLALAIHKRGFPVLEEYVGAAALAMTYMSNPNALYLYHGASKDKVEDEFIWVERPLFILHQPEGLYFSSMPESLVAISENGAEPIDLFCNRVFEIIDGEITDFKFRVHRDNKNIKPVKQPIKQNPIAKWVNRKLLPPSTSLSDDNSNDMVRSEPLNLQDSFKDIVSVRHGRYYANGKLLNGEVEINRNSRIVESNIISDFHSGVFYFIRGVMMKDKSEFEKAESSIEHGEERYLNVAQMLSAHSKYPVFNLAEEATSLLDAFKNRWYESGKQVSYERAFTTKFVSKTYFIKHGRTREIRTI